MMRVLWIAFAAVLGTPGLAAAGEVVAHPATNLTIDEVREVYVGERQLVGSTRLVPVENAAQQNEFLARVMQLDLSKYNARWTKKSFREGLMPPSVKGSDAEVIAYVRATPGAIGYVGASGPGVKVLHKY